MIVSSTKLTNSVSVKNNITCYWVSHVPYCVLNDRIASTQFISQFQALVAAIGSQIHVDEFRKSRIDSLPFIVLHYTVDRMQMDSRYLYI